MNEINTEYKEQYLRYKNKYLELKKINDNNLVNFKGGNYSNQDAEADAASTALEEAKEKEYRAQQERIEEKILEENKKKFEEMVFMVVIQGYNGNQFDSIVFLKNIISGKTISELESKKDNLYLDTLNKESKEIGFINISMRKFIEAIHYDLYKLISCERVGDRLENLGDLSKMYTVKFFINKDGFILDEDPNSKNFQSITLSDEDATVELEIGNTSLKQQLGEHVDKLLNSWRVKNKLELDGEHILGLISVEDRRADFRPDNNSDNNNFRAMPKVISKKVKENKLKNNP